MTTYNKPVSEYDKVVYPDESLDTLRSAINRFADTRQLTDMEVIITTVQALDEYMSTDGRQLPAEWDHP